MIKKKIKEIDELFNGYFIPVVATLSTIICMVVYVVIIYYKNIFV